MTRQPIRTITAAAFHPHVHVGAFRGDMMSEDAVPLQVRMDLGAMGRIRGTVGNPASPHPRALTATRPDAAGFDGPTHS